jgi:hypothetical protein
MSVKARVGRISASTGGKQTMFAILDSGHPRAFNPARNPQASSAHRVLYFADQANAPLGVRTPRELHAMLQNYLAFFEIQRITTLAVGSNTRRAVAAQHGCPRASFAIADILDAASAASIASPLYAFRDTQSRDAFRYASRDFMRRRIAATLSST